jgi:toxin YoeB
MSGGKRRSPGSQHSPALPTEARQAIVLQQFRQDLTHWIGSEPRTASRIMRLVEEVLRDPFLGVGKPEALKHGLSGRWSRRITDRDRLVYLVKGDAAYFIAARSHYEYS